MSCRTAATNRAQASNRSNIERYINFETGGNTATSLNITADLTSGAYIETKIDINALVRDDSHSLFYMLGSTGDQIKLYKNASSENYLFVVKQNGTFSTVTVSGDEFNSMLRGVNRVGLYADGTSLKAYLNNVQIGTTTATGASFVDTSWSVNIGRVAAGYEKNQKVYSFKVYGAVADPTSITETPLEEWLASEAKPTEWTGTSGGVLTPNSTSLVYPWDRKREQISKYLGFNLEGYAYGTLTGADFSSGFAIETDVYFGKQQAYAQRHTIIKLYISSTTFVDIVHVTDTTYRWRIDVSGTLKTVNCSQFWADKMYSSRRTLGIASDGTTLYGTVNGIPVVELATGISLPSTEPILLINAVLTNNNDYSKPSKYYGVKIWDSYKDLWEVYNGDHDSTALEIFKPSGLTNTAWTGENGLALDTYTGSASYGDPYVWGTSRTQIEQFMQFHTGDYAYSDISDIDFTAGFTVQFKARIVDQTVILGEVGNGGASRANLYWQTGNWYTSVIAGGTSVKVLDQYFIDKIMGKVATWTLTHDGSVFYVGINGVQVATGTRAGTVDCAKIFFNANYAGAGDEENQIHSVKLWNTSLDIEEAYNGDHDSTVVENFDFAQMSAGSLVGTKGHTITTVGTPTLTC